jgi:hypothetical protein
LLGLYYSVLVLVGIPRVLVRGFHLGETRYGSRAPLQQALRCDALGQEVLAEINHKDARFQRQVNQKLFDHEEGL